MNELNSEVTVEYHVPPEYYSDDLQLDIQVTDLPDSDSLEDIIESDDNQFDLADPVQVVDLDNLQEYLALESDSVDYSDQLVLIHEDLQQLDQTVRSCGYFLSALLFMLLFWFCYNRVKNAVRLFTGGRNNGYK